MLTSCPQAEVFSDLLMVTGMGEVKDAVASEVHLEDDNKDENVTKTNIKPLNEIPLFLLSFINVVFCIGIAELNFLSLQSLNPKHINGSLTSFIN